MNLLRPLTIFFFLSLLVLAGRVISVTNENAEMPDRIKTEGNHKRNIMKTKHHETLRKLDQDYRKKMLAATGDTVFDRIYNTQEQSIPTLLKRLARTKLPKNWSFDIKTEEFKNFVLNIYLPHYSQNLSAEKKKQYEEALVSYLIPIIKYGDNFLKNVAVFDRRHKSYLFFDETMLEKIKKVEVLSKELVARAEKQSESFTQFDSKTIKGKKYEDQLWIPIEVTGSLGSVTAIALLDTGANKTLVERNAVTETGSESLKDMPRTSLYTAGGVISSPLVTRKITLGDYRFQKEIEIVVGNQEGLNLIGMDYFKGMHYLIDIENSAIYVW